MNKLSYLILLLFSILLSCSCSNEKDIKSNHQNAENNLPIQLFDIAEEQRGLIFETINLNKESSLRSLDSQSKLLSKYQLPSFYGLKKFRLRSGEEFYMAEMYPISEPTNTDILFAGFVLDGDRITKQLYVRMYNPCDGDKKIEIYTPDEKLLALYSVDVKRGIMLYPSDFRAAANDGNGNDEWGEYEDRSDCILKCIDRLYTKNGWGSIALICVSACFPEATIGATLYCGAWCEGYKNGNKEASDLPDVD